MQSKDIGGFQRLIDATRYSAKGLQAVWHHEAAFRQEVLAVAVLVPVSFWLGTTMVQRALLVLCLLIILIVELINSALETVVDRIGTEHHPLSGQAKNMGSAAVLFSIVMAAVVWTMIAWQRWG
jgi:diacylglycerol kinase (ATP)